MKPPGNTAASVVALWSNQWGLDVYRYCRKMLGNDADAEDLMQTVFMQAIEDHAMFRSETSPRFWLLKIARNRCLDRLRVVRRRPAEVEEEVGHEVASDDTSLDEALAGSEAATALGGCLDALPPQVRAVMVLRYHDHLSYEQISKVTKDGEGALRIRVMRALPVLRDCLEKKGISW